MSVRFFANGLIQANNIISGGKNILPSNVVMRIFANDTIQINAINSSAKNLGLNQNGILSANSIEITNGIGLYISSDPFPRTAVLMVGPTPSLIAKGTVPSANLPFANIISQSNMGFVGFYVGFEGNENVTESNLCENWKSMGANNGIVTRVMQYTPGMAPRTEINGPAGGGQWLAFAFSAANMWTYNTASGSGNTGLHQMYNGYLPDQGTLMVTTASAQTVPAFTYTGETGTVSNLNMGLNVWQVPNQFYYDIYVSGLGESKYGIQPANANPYLDGFFIDNMIEHPPGTGTYNGWGTTPISDTLAANTIWQNGYAKYIAALKTIDSDMLAVGNAGNWVDANIAISANYQNSLDVVFWESVIGSPGALESTQNNPVGNWMNWLIKVEQIMSPTGTLVLAQSDGANSQNILQSNQSTWGPLEWQNVRYGFAAAMMRNWHYCLNCGVQQYSSPGLMDEQVQTVNGKSNYGWLSAGTQRLDPPQNAASTLSGIFGSGVWARRFPNGLVLWNPRGNGIQTITIPATLSRISTRGYGDANVNTGQVVSNGTVTLQDTDGLFLIGIG